MIKKLKGKDRERDKDDGTLSLLETIHIDTFSLVALEKKSILLTHTEYSEEN